MTREQIREIIPDITGEQLALLEAAYGRDLLALTAALAEARQREPPGEKRYLREEPPVSE